MRRKLLLLASCVPILLQFSARMAFGWGPLTHVSINREAFAGSNLSESGLDSFSVGAHSPDMISFWHIATGDEKYDYAHNLIDGGDGHTVLEVDNDEGRTRYGLPLFGKKMLKSYLRTKRPQRFRLGDKYFAYGWIGHQLADKSAHGTSGYASASSLFEGLPSYVKRIGNHGASELVVDAIVYEQNPDIGIKASCSPALLHEAAIKYFNETKYADASGNFVHSIKRSELVNCQQAKRMAMLWSRWLPVNRLLAEMASSSWWWFPEAKEYYSDYIESYNHSVDEVAAFLDNPTYEIASSRKSPFARSLAGLFDRMKRFFGSEKVQAEEGEETKQLPETLYYTFVNDVAQEAETLGALQTSEQTIVADPNVTGARSYEFSTDVVNEDGFQQALTTVINRDLAETNPLEMKLWAKFMEGLYLRDDLSFREITTRAQDFTPPTITNLTPADGSFINNPRPAIYASVDDDLLGIGLDLQSLNMRVNGTPVNYSYIDEGDISMVLYTPPVSLPDGEHTAGIEAVDKAGNRADGTWSFTVDTIPPEVSYQVQNKIINVAKPDHREAKVSLIPNEPVTYLVEVFRIKNTLLETQGDEERILKGEKVYAFNTSLASGDASVIRWGGEADDGQPVPNGVYTMRITVRDKAGNETSFEEQVNVNNEAGGG